MKKQHVAPGAVLAFWLGNPILNPATIIFMGFVLGWNWALLRIFMGLVLVVGMAYVGNRWMDRDRVLSPATADQLLATSVEIPSPSLVSRFFKELGRLVIGLMPEYLIIVIVLGAVRAWLFPQMSPAIGHSVWLILGMAVAGTLFVIPTAGEIPIVQGLMSYGLGLTAAGTLMLTLPAVSLPSMFMVGQQMGRRNMVVVGVVVAVAGLVTGVLAHWLL